LSPVVGSVLQRWQACAALAIILADTGRLIVIGTYATRAEAEIVEGLLASNGIESSISADDAGGAYPFVLSGGAQVFVDESDAEAPRNCSPSDPKRLKAALLASSTWRKDASADAGCRSSDRLHKRLRAR
jgi:hypothetical protein